MWKLNFTAILRDVLKTDIKFEEKEAEMKVKKVQHILAKQISDLKRGLLLLHELYSSR